MANTKSKLHIQVDDLLHVARLPNGHALHLPAVVMLDGKAGETLRIEMLRVSHEVIALSPPARPGVLDGIADGPRLSDDDLDELKKFRDELPSMSRERVEDMVTRALSELARAERTVSEAHAKLEDAGHSVDEERTAHMNTKAAAEARFAELGDMHREELEKLKAEHAAELDALTTPDEKHDAPAVDEKPQG